MKRVIVATWITHLRLAQNMLDYGFELSVTPFLTGNLAPDCGILDVSGNYAPSKDLTHWRDHNHNIQPEDFYAAYLLNAQHDDRDEYAFLLGYYCHLVTDVEWYANVWQPLVHLPPHAITLQENPDFVQLVKQDWYAHDFQYLQRHPNSAFFAPVQQVQAVPDYLQEIPTGYLTAAIQKITHFYTDAERIATAQAAPHPYLTSSEWDGWIETATYTLLSLLKSKGVLCPNPRPLSGYSIRTAS